MIRLGCSLVIAGGLGLCTTKVVISKAVQVLHHARQTNSESVRKTALTIAGYGLVVLGALTMTLSLGAIASVVGASIALALPDGTFEIVMIPLIILGTTIARAPAYRMADRLITWLNFSDLAAFN